MIPNTPAICLVGGQGQMGSWLQRYFKSHDIPVTTVDKKNLDDAPFRIANSDIVIISVPISETTKAIKTALRYIKDGSLLTDITPLKTEPVKVMSQAGSGVGVLGMHPLFGPLVASLRNQIVVFSPVRNNQWIEYLRSLFEADGAQIVTLEPEEHDRRMAAVQVMTHILNSTFIRVLGQLGFTHYHNLSTPVFRLQNILAGRILGGDPELYGELAILNPYAKEVTRLIDREIKEINRLVTAGDKQGYVKAMTEAAEQITDYIPIAKSKSAEILSQLDARAKLRFTPPPAVKAKKVKTVLTLGPAGTFSDRATQFLFPKLDDIVLQPTISQVFDATLQDETSLGVVPIENSTQGIVQETLDNLLRYPLPVVGSYTMPIELALLGRTDNLEEIKVIRSHSQPLAQARNWLAVQYPEVKLETAASSAQAILSTEEPAVAFVAHQDAAETYNLKVLAENIQDKRDNRTQFYCISPIKRPVVSRELKVTKTLLLLTVHDVSGVLRDILNAFADRGLNLSRLDSHRSEVPDWDYYFFLEVEALPEEPPLKDALKAIERHCYTLRVLGVV